ncbi:MAG: response regulator [bacterium]
MRNILIVDDEEAFLLSAKDGLKSYAKDLNILTARNGKEAIDTLKSIMVDLVITDLKMPVMDGFELLAYISRECPLTPVLVMTAYGTPEIESRLKAVGVSPYLEKPLDLNILAERIFGELVSNSRGFIQGFSLASFLQMLEIERKSCTLKVRSKKGEGYLYFLEGELMDATFNNMPPEKAAYEIVVWDEVEMEIKTDCNRKKKAIKDSLRFILMEAFQIKDEKKQAEGGDAYPKKSATKSKGKSLEVADAGGAGTSASNPPTPQKEVTTMAIQDKLKEFTGLAGFLGVGVFTPTGESLGILANDKTDLNTVGVLANNVLMNAQKASLEMGTGRGQLVHVIAEKAHIIVRCLNEGTDPLKSMPGKAHIHLVLILGSDEAIGMAKLKVGAIIPQIAEECRM